MPLGTISILFRKLLSWETLLSSSCEGHWDLRWRLFFFLLQRESPQSALTCDLTLDAGEFTFVFLQAIDCLVHKDFGTLRASWRGEEVLLLAFWRCSWVSTSDMPVWDMHGAEALPVSGLSAVGLADTTSGSLCASLRGSAWSSWVPTGTSRLQRAQPAFLLP